MERLFAAGWWWQIPMDKQDEILLTPVSLLLPAEGQRCVIRLFHKGLVDDKERITRIVWF